MFALALGAFASAPAPLAPTPAALASPLAFAFVRHPTTRSAKVSARKGSTPTAVNSPVSKSDGRGVEVDPCRLGAKANGDASATHAHVEAAPGRSRLLGERELAEDRHFDAGPNRGLRLHAVVGHARCGGGID